MAKINPAIIEDLADFREKMHSYFASETATFANLHSFNRVKTIRELPFSFGNYLLLLGINLQGMSGIEGILMLKRKFNDLDILMISCRVVTRAFLIRFAQALRAIMTKKHRYQKLRRHSSILARAVRP